MSRHIRPGDYVDMYLDSDIVGRFVIETINFPIIYIYKELDTYSRNLLQYYPNEDQWKIYDPSGKIPIITLLFFYQITAT